MVAQNLHVDLPNFFTPPLHPTLPLILSMAEPRATLRRLPMRKVEK